MVNIKIANYLKKYVDFSTEELELFFRCVSREVFEKNKYLTTANEGNACFYLVESGCLMTSVKCQNDQQHVMQFASDFWWTGDLEGIINLRKSNQSIKSIERTIVYKLDSKSYHQLLDSSHNFERYFRILFQNSLISHQKRLIKSVSLSAEERYLQFSKQFPQIETLVSQKYIASYLGVTPEFFSKLKKQLAEKEMK